MNKETYERTDIEVTEFENEDVIATSGIDPSGPPSRGKYEGRGFSIFG